MPPAIHPRARCSVASRVNPTPTDRLQLVAQRLREARRKSGLSATEVAARIHRGRSSVHQWESGDSSPTAVDLAALADLFRCSADWLLGRDLATGFFALVDSRCERLLASTSDLREFLGRLPTLSCVLTEETRSETSFHRVAAIMGEALTRGDALREAAAARKNPPAPGTS